MADVFDRKKRSSIMSNIRSSNTKPEEIVSEWLSDNDYDFIENSKDLPGKPDIVLNRYRTVIFIHGCFWHHHPNCKRATLPKTNKKYWIPKIKNNTKRDKRNATKLRRMGWHVITIWECNVKKDVDITMRRVEKRYLSKYIQT